MSYPYNNTTYFVEDDSASETSSVNSESEGFRVKNKLRIYLDQSLNERFDQITVSPILNTEIGEMCKFRVTYNYDLPTSNTISVFDFTGEETFDYIRRMLQLVAWDDEPYRKVEFDIPMFPCVSHTPFNLRNKVRRHLVLSAIHDYLNDCLNGEYETGWN
jgi:hypothetical protein